MEALKSEEKVKVFTTCVHWAIWSRSSLVNRLFLETSSHETTHLIGAHGKRDRNNLQHDERTCSRDLSPFPTSVLHKIDDCYRCGHRVGAGQDEGEEEIIPREHKAKDGCCREAGAESGRVIRGKACQILQPSVQAASSKDCGTASKNPVIIHTTSGRLTVRRMMMRPVTVSNRCKYR
jgi:hypothetical protein